VSRKVIQFATRRILDTLIPASCSEGKSHDGAVCKTGIRATSLGMGSAGSSIPFDAVCKGKATQKQRQKEPIETKTESTNAKTGVCISAPCEPMQELGSVQKHRRFHAHAQKRSPRQHDHGKHRLF